jgi:hypothetical protein
MNNEILSCSVINYMSHEFVLRHFDTSNTYAEFNCKICGIDAAMRYISYKWYYSIWKELDISCEEMVIKKLLE